MQTVGGAPILDVLTIGGGQCGLAVAFAPMRDQVRNLLVIDRAPAGLDADAAAVHLFSIGTSMSFGPAGASIDAMAIAAPRVAAGVTRGPFEQELARLWDSLCAYADPQVDLMRPLAVE